VGSLIEQIANAELLGRMHGSSNPTPTKLWFQRLGVTYPPVRPTFLPILASLDARLLLQQQRAMYAFYMTSSDKQRYPDPMFAFFAAAEDGLL
jgi:hypothetical protein